MDGEGQVEFLFVCPACHEDLEVKASMREGLLKKRCVSCGASLTERAFTAMDVDGGQASRLGHTREGVVDELDRERHEEECESIVSD